MSTLSCNIFTFSKFSKVHHAVDVDEYGYLSFSFSRYLAMLCLLSSRCSSTMYVYKPLDNLYELALLNLDAAVMYRKIEH